MLQPDADLTYEMPSPVSSNASHVVGHVPYQVIEGREDRLESTFDGHPILDSAGAINKALTRGGGTWILIAKKNMP